MSHFGKSAAVPVFVRFLSAFSVCMRRKQSGHQALRTTKVKDTHLTLAVIPFKVDANNSLIFLPSQTYKTKFAEFPFLFIFIIPWLCFALTYPFVRLAVETLTLLLSVTAVMEGRE